MSGQEGVFFEDFVVGQEYTSPGRTVTEADIVIFAGLSGDYNVLHTDAEHMKTSIFGERIAHGLLGLGIQQGLASRGEPAAAHGLLSGLKWKFKGPIKIGDTVLVLSRIAAKRDGPDAGRGLVTVERRLVNQQGEVVQEGETEHVVERRKP
ncbi:MAG: MaoC/PaaZ C-terminal domain-containing protein [Candidatus Rokubacteria bacterium]|nr:MaoC/PaaZ C-terminal domain-containing protein [Candidatus Rokubacteria bacterium]